MPIVTVEEAAERKRRQGWGCGRWLLCVVPGMLLLLRGMAAVRPLQLGPFVVTVDHLYLPRSGWSVYCGPSTRGPVVHLHEAEPGYAVRAPGHACGLYLGDWLVGIAWFWGHPVAG